MTIKKEEVVSLGIVLKTHPYKESDSLVTVYFKDYGKMTLIARGVKKLKSKNASACQSLTLSEFTFIPRNGLSMVLVEIRALKVRKTPAELLIDYVISMQFNSV